MDELITQSLGRRSTAFLLLVALSVGGCGTDSKPSSEPALSPAAERMLHSLVTGGPSLPAPEQEAEACATDFIVERLGVEELNTMASRRGIEGPLFNQVVAAVESCFGLAERPSVADELCRGLDPRSLLKEMNLDPDRKLDAILLQGAKEKSEHMGIDELRPCSTDGL